MNVPLECEGVTGLKACAGERKGVFIVVLSFCVALSHPALSQAAGPR